MQLERISRENLIKRAEAAEAELQVLKDLHAASQAAPLAAGPSVQGKSTEADALQNTHHNSEIELSNKNADVAVAASRLHVNTLKVPH